MRHIVERIPTSGFLQVLMAKPKKMVKIEPHLVKHYRIRFEQSFRMRYQKREEQEIDILPLLVTFVQALGFHTSGQRKINMDDQDELLDDLFTFFAKQGSLYDKHEVVLAKHLAIAAFTYDYGGDVWEKYSALESLYRMCYNVNHNRVRIRGKEVYSCIAMRFDQFLTCSPITPIQWSSIEKMGKSYSSRWVKMEKVSDTSSPMTGANQSSGAAHLKTQMRLSTLE